jgi:hypothetical protein
VESELHAGPPRTESPFIKVDHADLQIVVKMIQGQLFLKDVEDEFPAAAVVFEDEACFFWCRLPAPV